MYVSSDKGSRSLSLIIAVLLLGGSFLFFQLVLPYHLYFKEQLKLFLHTSGYFLSYFSKPAWLASYVGDFFTQLFFLKGRGALTIAAILFIEWLLIKKIVALFGNKIFSPLWALLPVVGEWIFFADIGYTLSLPVVFIITLSVFLIYTKINNKWISIATGILLIPFLYWTAGAGMFFFALILILYDIRCERYRVILWIILLLETAAIPFLLRPGYLLTLKQAYFYPYPDIKEAIPFIILSVILILMQIREIREMSRRMVPFAVSILLPIVVLIPGALINANFEREKILAVSTEYYSGNTTKVIELAEKYELSNPLATYYTNLALSEQGQLGDRLLDFYQPSYSGLFLSVNETPDWFTVFCSNDVFFHIGDINLAAHSAMQGIILSPYNQSSRLLIRLAEINLVNNDNPAAEKYVRILKSTWLHKNFITGPEYKHSQLAMRDIIRMPDDYQASLNILLESNPENTEALNYLLCFHLLNKDIKNFKTVYDRYFTAGTIPRIYQQALLMYFAIEGAKKNEREKYKIDTRTVEYFNRYIAYLGETKADPDAMQEAFSGTYWIYYHYANFE